jgi:hypothetical protein
MDTGIKLNTRPDLPTLMALGLLLVTAVMEHLISTEELRVHCETDAEGVGTRADADTERLAEQDWESAEERRRSAYRLT